MDGIAAARTDPRPGAAVAIGNFDGVHLGHRLLVARAIEAARARNLRSVVLTFDRHPATVVRPESTPRLLTSGQDKLALLRATGVDELVVLRFDAARAAESAEDFVRSMLVEDLETRVVVVGATFRFGHRQGGDVALLEAMGRELGFDVIRVDLVAGGDGDGGVPVSSSRIRGLVATGRLDEAAKLLGRPHGVRATLVGEPWTPAPPDPGRLVLAVAPELLVPPPGSYAAEVELAAPRGAGQGRHAAVVTVDAAPAPARGEGPASSVLVSSLRAPVRLVAVLSGRADGSLLRDATPGPPRPGDEIVVRFVGRAGGSPPQVAAVPGGAHATADGTAAPSA